MLSVRPTLRGRHETDRALLHDISNVQQVHHKLHFTTLIVVIDTLLLGSNIDHTNHRLAHVSVQLCPRELTDITPGGEENQLFAEWGAHSRNITSAELPDTEEALSVSRHTERYSQNTNCVRAPISMCILVSAVSVACGGK